MGLHKLVVAPDTFKGGISAATFCRIASERVHHFFPDCTVISLPAGDGGEGTVAALVAGAGWEAVEAEATGPWGEKLKTVYARKGERALVEWAGCAGWAQAGERKNPEQTTSWGVGEVIQQAVWAGCRRVGIGLGGCCTHDVGCGMAAALGVRFWDEAGREFVPCGATLGHVANYDRKEAMAALAGVEITGWCDVDNPMIGANGAARMFAPQKGADADMVERLEAGTAHLMARMQTTLNATKNKAAPNLSTLPGGGAAGAAGGGIVGFLGGSLCSGIDEVLDALDFETVLTDADAVWTGEGAFDAQSLHNKTVVGVARRAAAYGVPVSLFAGRVAQETESGGGVANIRRIWCINPSGEPLERSMARAEERLAATMDKALTVENNG